ncbi:MAG: hypothetical protein ACREFE_03820 [Limisphaerales bacterium]
MKHFLNILPGILFAAALILLYRAHMELKYNFEAFAWQTKDQADRFSSMIATSYQRTRHDAKKITELKLQIKTLTAMDDQTNQVHPDK